MDRKHLRKTGRRRKGTINPKSLANLKPCRPGEVRNPKGRPPGRSTLADCIRQRLQGPVRNLFDRQAVAGGHVALSKRLLDKPLAEAIAVMCLKEVLKGKLAWLEMVLDQAESKATAPPN